AKALLQRRFKERYPGIAVGGKQRLTVSQGGADSLLLGVEIEGIMSHLPSPARLLVDEIALALELPAARDGLRAFCKARFEIAANSTELAFGNHRPICVLGSSPGPTLIFLASSATPPTSLSKILSCTNNRDPAQQH